MRRTRLGSWLVLGLAALTLLAAAPAEAQKKTLVVALNQDPDLLDPTLSRTYVGRIVFEHMCEKLYELDEHLRIFPQLAAAMPAISDGGKTVTIKLRSGVKFNDGTPMNADAVKFSLDRHREMKGSNRRSELESACRSWGRSCRLCWGSARGWGWSSAPSPTAPACRSRPRRRTS